MREWDWWSLGSLIINIHECPKKSWTQTIYLLWFHFLFVWFCLSLVMGAVLRGVTRHYLLWKLFVVTWPKDLKVRKKSFGKGVRGGELGSGRCFLGWRTLGDPDLWRPCGEVSCWYLGGRGWGGLGEERAEKVLLVFFWEFLSTLVVPKLYCVLESSVSLKTMKSLSSFWFNWSWAWVSLKVHRNNFVVQSGLRPTQWSPRNQEQPSCLLSNSTLFFLLSSCFPSSSALSILCLRIPESWMGGRRGREEQTLCILFSG